MRPFILLALLTVAAAPPMQKAGPAAAPHPAGAVPPGPPALLAAIPPDAPADRLRRLLLQPYASATGTDLAQLSWQGGGSLKGLLAAHGADLVLVDAATLADLCRTQAATKLDWPVLDRGRTVAGAATDCGDGAYLDATALAWDKAKFAGTPTWGDFWDIARHPGRRGLQARARGTLEIALLADGVAPADVYRTLRTPDGLDRAFRKLDQLKPYVVWWNRPAEAADLLASGKALMTSAPIGTMAAAGAARPALGVTAAGSLTSWFSWVIPQGAPHPAAAMVSLVIAADPARQAEFARATGLGPATAAALDLLPQEVRQQSPSLPANVSQSLAIDETFWLDNGAKLESRFSAWQSKQ